MAEKLKVDIPGLIGASSEVADQAAALDSSHIDSVRALAAAESGWVGSSADALVSMAGTWQQSADSHHSALTQQAEHVAEAALLFQSADERSAVELGQVAD